MSILTSKKAIIGLLSLGSLVLAGTLKESSHNSVESQAVIEEVALERTLASDGAQQVAQIYLPVNAANLSKINTNWEITRIIGSDQNVVFDKMNNQEDAKKSIKVKFELISTSLVRIDGDNQQVYRVSLLSDFGTIALFKKMGNGYEIIEAKKVIKKIEKVAVTNDVELVLERALNQSKSSKILMGQDAVGEMLLTKTSIEDLNVELVNTNGEVQRVEIARADLLDGGSFKAEVDGEEVSGVVFNNGKDGYRLSFVTGPLAGAMLNFVTREQLENLSESNSANEIYYTEDSVEEVAQAQVLEEREVIAKDVENYEPVRILSADEIKETAEVSGFNF